MSGSVPVAARDGGNGRRPSFTSGGEVFREIQRDVEAVLSRKGIRTRALVQLHLKTVIALSLPVLAWIVLIAASPGLVLGLACLVVLALGAMLVAFCVQHDANHGASFGSRRVNRIFGFSADALLGFSSYAWRVKHNVAHHTYTNVDAYDDDISQVPFARLLPAQSSRWWYRLQHFYIWPMYSLMVLRMQAFGDLAALFRGRIGRSKLRMPRGWDLVGIVGGKLVYVSWAIVIPLLVYPWWVVVVAYVGVAMVVGLVTATTFQLAHCVDEANYRSSDELGGRRHRLGRPPDRVDGRLLPAQPRAHVGARRPQLPDRAPPVPAPPPHPVPADRGNRPGTSRGPRRALHVPAVVVAGALLAREPRARDGPPRRAGRDRDGLARGAHELEDRRRTGDARQHPVPRALPVLVRVDRLSHEDRRRGRDRRRRRRPR